MNVEILLLITSFQHLVMKKKALFLPWFASIVGFLFLFPKLGPIKKSKEMHGFTSVKHYYSIEVV